MGEQPGRLAGKVALITGASGGQGLAAARLFAAEGAALLLADLQPERANALATQLRAQGTPAHAVGFDVRDRSAWQHAVEQAHAQFGALHILVNNAGIVSRAGILEVTAADWDAVLGVNLTSALYGMQAAAPLIRDAGGGSIVNISSTAALLAYAGAAYAASKWALRGLTKTAAMEFADAGVRVNSVHPAQVAATGIAGDASADYRRITAQILPAGRPASPAEVAACVLFLASDESRYVNGTELVVDGGYASFGLPRMRERLLRQAQTTPTGDTP